MPRSVNDPSYFADGQAHEIDGGREEQGPLILSGGRVREQAVQERSVEGKADGAIGHDRNGGLLDETVQKLGEEHGGVLFKQSSWPSIHALLRASQPLL
jgi:hypothetical protein